MFRLLLSRVLILVYCKTRVQVVLLVALCLAEMDLVSFTSVEFYIVDTPMGI